ncbi:MAG TPA: hypothetical protein VN894_08895, partial [Polyangiaceae bacterium]|nr:hypothetical protein [Polyangiaceae bacterium]
MWAGHALAIGYAGWVSLATTAAARAEAPRASAADATARIRLKGSAHLDVHAAREAGGLVLSGSVIDDAARPLPAARVRIALALASDPARSLSLSAAQSCGGANGTPIVDRGGSLVLTADETGRLCIRLGLATNRYVAHIEASGSELVDGATIDLPIDLALPPVTLRFDPERSAVSLDDDTTSFDVIASTEEEGVTAPATGLLLSLSSEVGTRLAEATTDASGHARFTVDSAHLGPPGKGEVRVTFAGNAAAGAGSHAMRVERQTAVELRAPDATARRLPLAWPEDGVALRLVAEARCISRGCTAAPGGTIEARVGDHTFVGAAPIDRGEAHLLVTFAAPSA